MQMNGASPQMCNQGYNDGFIKNKTTCTCYVYYTPPGTTLFTFHYFSCFKLQRVEHYKMQRRFRIGVEQFKHTFT